MRSIFRTSGSLFRTKRRPHEKSLAAVCGANVDARGVAVEVLGVGEGDDRFGIARQALLGVSLDTGALEEFVDADAACEACGRVRRQTVAGAGDVIAGGDGRVSADEDGAGVSEL